MVDFCFCQSSFNVNPLYQTNVQQFNQPGLPNQQINNLNSYQYGNNQNQYGYNQYQQVGYNSFGSGPQGIIQLKEYEKWRDHRVEEGAFASFHVGKFGFFFKKRIIFRLVSYVPLR